MKRLLAFCLLSMFCACEKKADLSELSYQETQCADKWQRGNTDAITLENVKTYLSSRSITVERVELTGSTNNGAACLACICPTGRIITVSFVDDANVKSELIALGFK